MTETARVAQDHFMAEIKRVGTQQEALKKAVAEAIATARDSGESFSVGPLKNFDDPTKPTKAASPVEEGPGIQAAWVEAASTSRQASLDAATQQAKTVAEAVARAESLPKPAAQNQFTPVEQEPAQQEASFTKPNQSAAAIAEMQDNPAVKERRGDLSKMQIALGGSDNTGAAAFDPSQYTFGQLPSSGDKRSKQQRKDDAKKLAAQRKEDERLKAKERKWREEQRRQALQKADADAEEVRLKLFSAQLGPTPSTAGGQKVAEKPKATATQPDKEQKTAATGSKKKWWRIWS